MARLKQIKHTDLGENTKKVVDSLIDTGRRNVRREEKKEQMRCKVEIYEGTLTKVLVDSFVVNTDYIEDTVTDIVLKFGANVQFVITNLYDDKIVAKRFVYKDGYDKEREDRTYYNKRLELAKKVYKLKEEGRCVEEVADKLCHLAARKYIKEIYDKTEEEVKQQIRDEYGNQSLGINNGILSEDLNTNKEIIGNSNLNEETDKSGDENEE